MALNSLIRTSDLSPVDVARILYHAEEFRQQPDRNGTLLQGRTVVQYFAKPSTRTRLSLHEAVARLGGVPVAVNDSDLQLERGETVEDTARVVSRYAAAFTARTFSDELIVDFARSATVPVVNALTDTDHPLQSLADLMTIGQRFGSPKGCRVAYLGDANNVCTSLLQACALTGAHITVAAPEGYGPDPATVAHAAALAEPTEGSVSVTTDPEEACRDADVVYTDVWVSMGDPAESREARLNAFAPYQVTERLMGLAAGDVIFMHCLPAHRGQEVEARVMDGPASMVFDQAENRLWTSMAVLAMLLRGRLEGR